MELGDFVVFNDKKLERKWGEGPVPLATLYEAYFDGAIDIPGDMYKFLANRNKFVKYTLTMKHIGWFITNMLPEVFIHSKDQDRRIVREHYDRGNDFFGWFLGDRMVYTSGIFENPDQTLETSQDNKLNVVFKKLQLKPNETLLDIGCGWGTLIRHAARDCGVDATGVTIAERQTEMGNERILAAGLQDKARVVCSDYRDIPKQKFNKIVSLEMVEHVGLKNLTAYYQQIYEMLDDDGLCLIQWTGLRRRMKPEDMIWGLFMNKYIFPGADASLPPCKMLSSMEKVGFEIQHVENISIHYTWTIRRWHDNWLANKDAVIAKYGERWFRIWHLFLAWSSIIGEQGNAACFQVVMNKNHDKYNRTRFVPRG